MRDKRIKNLDYNWSKIPSNLPAVLAGQVGAVPLVLVVQAPGTSLVISQCYGGGWARVNPNSWALDTSCWWSLDRLDLLNICVNSHQSILLGCQGCVQTDFYWWPVSTGTIRTEKYQNKTYFYPNNARKSLYYILCQKLMYWCLRSKFSSRNVSCLQYYILQSWARENSVATMWPCYQATKLFVIAILLCIFIVATSSRHWGINIFRFFSGPLPRCRCREAK